MVKSLTRILFTAALLACVPIHGIADSDEAVETDRSYPIKGYEVSDQEIFISGGISVVSGKSILDWQTMEAGEVVDSATSRSEFMTVLRKESGQWRIFRQMYQMRK